MPLRNTLRCLTGQEINPDKIPTFYEALTDIWRPIQTRCDFFEDELEMLECLANKKPEELQFKPDYYDPAHLQTAEHIIFIAKKLVDLKQAENERRILLIQKVIDPSLPEDQLPDYREVTDAIRSLKHACLIPQHIQLIKDVIAKGKDKIHAKCNDLIGVGPGTMIENACRHLLMLKGIS